MSIKEFKKPHEIQCLKNSETFAFVFSNSFISLCLFLFSPALFFWGVVGSFPLGSHARVSSGVVIKGAWFQCNLLAGLSKALDCWCGDMCLGFFWHEGRCEIPRGEGKQQVFVCIFLFFLISLFKFWLNEGCIRDL